MATASDKLKALNMAARKAKGKAVAKPNWDAEKHPRAQDGEFAPKGTGTAGAGKPKEPAKSGSRTLTHEKDGVKHTQTESFVMKEPAASKSTKAASAKEPTKGEPKKSRDEELKQIADGHLRDHESAAFHLENADTNWEAEHHDQKMGKAKWGAIEAIQELHARGTGYTPPRDLAETYKDHIHPDLGLVKFPSAGKSKTKKESPESHMGSDELRDELDRTTKQYHGIRKRTKYFQRHMDEVNDHGIGAKIVVHKGFANEHNADVEKSEQLHAQAKALNKELESRGEKYAPMEGYEESHAALMKGPIKRIEISKEEVPAIHKRLDSLHEEKKVLKAYRDKRDATLAKAKTPEEFDKIHDATEDEADAKLHREYQVENERKMHQGHLAAVGEQHDWPHSQEEIENYKPPARKRELSKNEIHEKLTRLADQSLESRHALHGIDVARYGQGGAGGWDPNAPSDEERERVERENEGAIDYHRSRIFRNNRRIAPLLDEYKKKAKKDWPLIKHYWPDPKPEPLIDPRTI